MYRVDARAGADLRPNDLSRVASVVTLAFLIVACGGGGGGGRSTSNGGAPNPPAPPSPTPTYTVSGTVTGLTNPAVLQVSGAADVTVSANGLVTLLTEVASGTSYSIGVRTQPSAPRQDCTVSNGAGTVAGNVENIVIACVDVPLTLSSSTPMHAATTAVRSGDMILTFSLPLDANVPSSAVTLQSAAGVVPTTFTTNGNQIIVTPSQRLLPVMSHTLTVGTQIRGSGGEQMTAPAVVSFTTADAVWGQAQIIETSMGSLSTPRLAVSPSGEAIAVWQDTSLGNQLHHTVAMNRYVAGAGWGPIPQHIAFSAPGGTIAGVQLALAASGDAIAVWAQDDDGDGSGVPSARANPRAAGTDWNHNDAMFLGSSTMRAENPHIALNARGNGVAVWQQRDASLNMNIWSRHYSSSNGWGVPTPIETSVSEAVSPRVAVADNGDAIVVWLELDDGYYSLWANRFAAAAGWSGAVLIETHTGQVVAPDIAMSSTGDAIVVWRSNSAGDNSIWANHYVVGRGWDDAVELGTPTTFTSSPHVALGADGNAIVVWGQREGTRYSVWSIRYAVGQGWGAPGLLETDDSGDAGGAQIAIDSRGNAIAVWAQYDGSRANLWARRYVAGSTWLAPTLIETDDAGDVGALQIGFDASGNAIAVWHQDDGQRFNIWANRFE